MPTISEGSELQISIKQRIFAFATQAVIDSIQLHKQALKVPLRPIKLCGQVPDCEPRLFPEECNELGNNSIWRKRRAELWSASAFARSGS